MVRECDCVCACPLFTYPIYTFMLQMVEQIGGYSYVGA